MKLLKNIFFAAVLLLFSHSLAYSQEEESVLRLIPYANTESWYVGVAVGPANWSCIAVTEKRNGTKVTVIKSFNSRYFVVLRLVEGFPESQVSANQILTLVSFTGGERYLEKYAQVMESGGIAIEFTDQEYLELSREAQLEIVFENAPEKYSEELNLSDLPEALEYLDMCFEESSEMLESYKTSFQEE